MLVSVEADGHSAEGAFQGDGHDTPKVLLLITEQRPSLSSGDANANSDGAWDTI